jgi:hypothetical protein
VEKTTAPAVEDDLRQPLPSRPREAVQQVPAGEAGDEGVARRGDELVWRADLEKPPLGDHTDAVGERGGIFEVVRDQDGRQGEVAEQLLELGADAGAGVRVERCHRLVEQQHGRIACQCTRESDTLALATRELSGSRRRQVRDAEPLHQLRRAAAAPEADVPLDRQVREECVLLETSPTLRRSGSRQTPATVSSHTVPPSTTRPDRGRSSPATTRSTVVFPAPEGPTSANVSPARRSGRPRRRRSEEGG